MSLSRDAIDGFRNLTNTGHRSGESSEEKKHVEAKRFASVDCQFDTAIRFMLDGPSFYKVGPVSRKPIFAIFGPDAPGPGR